MPSPSKSWYITAASMLLASSLAFGADIQINGVCQAGGTCPPGADVDALILGQSNSGNGSVNITVGVNNDPYTVSWTYADSFLNGNEVVINPMVVYTGATPTTTNDVIDFNFFQNFFSTAGSSWDGTYGETIPLVLTGTLGAATQLTGEAFYTTVEAGGGGGIGPVTLVGDGNTTGVNSANLTGLTGDTLQAEYEFAYDFTSGTGPGASGGSPTPEPAETLPIGIALVAAACYAVRRRSVIFG